jgi:hypothetical protein
LLSNVFTQVLAEVDRVENMLRALSERLRSAEGSTVRLVVEHVREVVALPFGLPVPTERKGPELAEPGRPIDWRRIEKSRAWLAGQLDVPLMTEPNERSVLGRFLTCSRKPPDNQAHWLHIAARRLESEQDTPLLCYQAVHRVLYKGYQRRTVQRVLNQMHGRAILADEVGLGKTIEAGLILTEYRLRHLVRRCLAWISTEARQPNAHPASGSIRSWGDKHLEWLVPSLALAVMCADNYLATVVD